MISIFVTDLKAYNEGYLLGTWINLPMGGSEIAKVVNTLLKDGERLSGSCYHDEIFITDYEADIHVREFDEIDKLNDIAEILEEYSEDDILKLKFLSSEGYHKREVIAKGIDSYDVDIYDYRESTSFTDTFELLASDMVDEGLFGEIPKSLESYIDYEQIARDLRMDYSEFEPNVIGRVA